MRTLKVNAPFSARMLKINGVCGIHNLEIIRKNKEIIVLCIVLT
jgi:hypothetical protein